MLSRLTLCFEVLLPQRFVVWLVHGEVVLVAVDELGLPVCQL